MTALATLMGFAFLGDLDADEQGSLGNFLMLIGQVLTTNSTQLQLLQNTQQEKAFFKMQQDICQLKEELASLRAQSTTSSSS